MKIFLAILGCAAFVLGVVGIFVPLLPTTPFLLLAAALWVRSSPRLYEWLLAHRCFGGYIRNFRENRAIPLRAKVVSIALMWGTMLYCIFGLLDGRWWAQGRPAGRGRRRHVAHPLVRNAAQVISRLKKPVLEGGGGTVRFRSGSAQSPVHLSGIPSETFSSLEISFVRRYFTS